LHGLRHPLFPKPTDESVGYSHSSASPTFAAKLLSREDFSKLPVRGTNCFAFIESYPREIGGNVHEPLFNLSKKKVVSQFGFASLCVLASSREITFRAEVSRKVAKPQRKTAK